MTDWINLANWGVACAGLTISILGFFLTMLQSYMDKISRRYFKVFFALLIAYILSDLTSQVSLYMQSAGYATLSRTAVFLESLFSSMLMPLLIWYLLYCAGRQPEKNRFLYGADTLFAFYVVLLVAAQFTTKIYYITDDNIYHRGPWYPVLLLPPALLMFLSIIALLQYQDSLTVRQRKAFAVYIIVPLLCMIFQMCFYGLLLIVIGSSVSALFMFAFILTDQMEQYVRQREEIVQSQASIQILKMRPHFIYNTMTSIYYLCEQNPKKAMETINHFTNYLRKNFSAIAKNEAIPFKEELEHTRTYLAIEQTRFEGKLFVEFDTPYINFRIPPLTLQPIVENSVKYGVDPELEPLYISVSTSHTDNGSEIIVTDTGPGFVENGNPADDNREPHIAIDNIRERLAMMCQGTLQFSAREGGGTVVRIWIPDKETSLSMK